MHLGLALLLLLITCYSDRSITNAIAVVNTIETTDKTCVVSLSSHSQELRKPRQYHALRLKGGRERKVDNLSNQDTRYHSQSDGSVLTANDKNNPSIEDIHLSRKAFHIVGGMYFAYLRNSYLSRESFVKIFLGCVPRFRA